MYQPVPTTDIDVPEEKTTEKSEGFVESMKKLFTPKEVPKKQKEVPKPEKTENKQKDELYRSFSFLKEIDMTIYRQRDIYRQHDSIRIPVTVYVRDKEHKVHEMKIIICNGTHLDTVRLELMKEIKKVINVKDISLCSSGELLKSGVFSYDGNTVYLNDNKRFIYIYKINAYVL